MNKLDEIVAGRRGRIKREGHSLGVRVPAARKLPLFPFGRSPFIICEIKRRSPSRGDIQKKADPVKQAALYREAGIRTVSILTEEDYFGGSLRDMMAVKKTFPDLAVLRKDFLLDPEDIDISFRAGADAVLLMASVLESKRLKLLYERARSYGMEVLVEVHSVAEIAEIREVRPSFTGINSRDLATFRIDLTLPLRLKREIDWATRKVFESGIMQVEHAGLAFGSGFDGILVGEAVMRRPDLLPRFIKVLNGADFACERNSKKDSFWGRLYGKKRVDRPFVKICGITKEEDFLLADDLGADIVGFVFAESPRRADTEFVRGLKETRSLKAGVVVLGPGDRSLPDDVRHLLEEGHLDVIQFHGSESPEHCGKMAGPYYKAIRIRHEDDIGKMAAYYCPRVLIDAHAAGISGGTGKRIDDELLRMAGKRQPLWIAGGISPGNIASIVEMHSPELIDLSSGLETEPGIKDHKKMKKLFRELS